MIVIDQYKFAASIVLVTITYGTVTGTLVESPAGRWGSGTGNGLSALSLPASTNGTYQADFSGAGYNDSVIGWDAANTNTTFSSFAYGVYIDSGSGKYAIIEAGTPLAASAFTATSGDKFRLSRTGSTIKAEYTTNGTTWNTIYTFSATSTARLYCKAHVAAAPNYILNPKGTNIT